MKKISFILAILMLFSAVSVFAADGPHIISVSLSENSSVLAPGQSVKLSAGAVIDRKSVV